MEKQTIVPRVTAVSIIVVLISGCAGLTTPKAVRNESSVEAPQLDIATLQKIESQFLVIDPMSTQIDVKDLQVSQQVRLFATACTREEMVNGGSTDVTEYIGTIASIDNDQINLTDVSLVTEVTAVATPMVAKVPYVSRLFKNTSVATQTQPLPHGIAIPCSRVLLVQSVGDGAAERIGVDFETAR